MKISLNGKEYESGKITREKYRKFAEVYEILLGKEKEAQTFSDDDLDSMIEAIVLVFGNQFTFEEADDGLDEISSIILNFSLINAEIMNNTNIQAEETAKEYTIKSVEHVAVEQQSRGEDTGEAKEEKKTVIGVNADLETTAEKVGVESPVNILDTLGITQGELDSIKGVLARYE